MTASTPGKLQRLGEVGRHVADAVLGRRLLRLVKLAADERDRLDAIDQPDRVEMLEAERARAGQRDFDGGRHFERTSFRTS
jgi:hypothetical protein